jgi:uncharacterized membrane protein
MDAANVRAGGPGAAERVASSVLGGALLALGLRRRSLGGTAMALASGGLLYRSITGRGPVLPMPGTRAPARLGRREAAARAEARAVERSITVGRPAEALYRLWRAPENLSRIMAHFAEVTATGDGRTHWRVHGPLGRTLEWDSQLVEDHPGESLRWESVGRAELPSEGSVRFRPAPGDWGTEVTLSTRFRPPGGALGQALSERLHIVPRMLVGRALRRFKSLAETGEIPTVARNPSARRGAETD